MSISKYLNPFRELFLVSFFLLSSFFIGNKFEKPSIFINKQSSSLNINNTFLTYFNLGQKRLISSTLWVSTILESDHDHYKNRDLNSWMFLRFNTIGNLDPLFYEVYAFGGPYLSIIKDDILGASLIYDKGINQYPNDFSLLRDSGFHYYFEVGDYNKALKSYARLKNHPKTNYIMATTLARLEAGEGNLEDAFTILSNQYSKIEDKESLLAKKISSFLYAIRAELDLACLNKRRSDCNQLDFEGTRYILANQSYRAVKKWTPFKTFRKK